MKWPLYFYALFPLTLYLPVVSAAEIRLNIPMVSDSSNQHRFYHELLTEAIKDIGHTPILKVLDIPQLRIKRDLDLGTLSIYWMLETAERNQRYIPIEVDLTNGLIGNRILLIKKGDQPLYDKVKNLKDFRGLGLVGGMGLNWFDVKVWQTNDLLYQEHEGNWASIFKMLPRGRGFHYFARGVNEISLEISQYPELQIEKNLLFIYDRDFRFYLSKTGTNAGEKYKDVISLAMKKAKESGLIDQLVSKYWGRDVESLNHAKRTKIYLSLPSEK